MPAVPERYVSQVAAQANRRIIETPQTQADTSIGDALQHVGKVALEIQTRIQQSQQDQELVKAEREAKTRLDRLKYDLEADAETPDAAIPKRWMQESDAIIKETAAGISSETARNLWTERAKGWQGEGENWSVGLQRKRSVDKVRAGHVTAASELAKQAGDLSISQDTFAANLGGAKVAIQRDLERGMIDSETAARQEAMLDGVAEKDSTARWSAGVLTVARSGDFEAAAKMVSSAPGIAEAVKEDALATIERERNRQEKERAETWRLNGNAYEMEVLQGGGSYKALQDKVEAGEINPNDQPALYRIIREEDDRRKRDAIAATAMNTAEKEAWKDQSADIRASFDALAGYDAATFMQPDKWSEDDQRAFAAMTPDDQRAIRIKINGMAANGVTSDAKIKVFGDLMAEAKRWAPPSWQLDSTKDGVRSWPRRALDSLLMKTAEELAPQLGGNAIQQKQAQEIVGRVLGQIDQKSDWSVIPSVAYNKAVSAAGLDPTWSKPVPVVDDRPGSAAYQKAFNDLKAASGKDPSPAAVQSLLMKRAKAN